MGKSKFEDAKFNLSWEFPSEMELFDRQYHITISADAYYETEKVTGEQESAYSEYLKNEKYYREKIENALAEEAGGKQNAKDRFKPCMLKIEKNGDMALLVDDTEDLENGIAVRVTPCIETLSIDQYL